MSFSCGRNKTDQFLLALSNSREDKGRLWLGDFHNDWEMSFSRGREDDGPEYQNALSRGHKKIWVDSSQEFPIQAGKRNTKENEEMSFSSGREEDRPDYPNALSKQARRQWQTLAERKWAGVYTCTLKWREDKGRLWLKKSPFPSRKQIITMVTSSLRQEGRNISYSDFHNDWEMSLSSMREDDGQEYLNALSSWREDKGKLWLGRPFSSWKEEYQGCAKVLGNALFKQARSRPKYLMPSQDGKKIRADSGQEVSCQAVQKNTN
ncbi:hypothetical protein CHS0354_026654, partial [Potamilus streckersoni]